MNNSFVKERFSKYCPLLSELTSIPDSDLYVRTFDLREGDEVSLKNIASDDCLFLSKGKLSVVINDVDETVLDGSDSSSVHLSIPEKADKIQLIAEIHTVVFQIDGHHIDNLLAWQEMLNFLDPSDLETRRYAAIVKNSKAFRHLPVEHFVDALKKLKPVSVSNGQDVVVQGEKGDAFYYIESGEAEVWELGIYDDEPQKVNYLVSGDSFGEESLVVDGSRTATVKMVTDGQLLRIEKADFLELISRPMVKWFEAEEVKSKLSDGYQLLDVRYEEEWEDSSIPGAVLIPLQSLRARYTELDINKPYITYCKGGARSAVAALLLTQRGYDVVSMKGGIRDWPYEVQSNY